MLYVFDPKAMYHVCIKDHNIYEEAEGFLVSNAILFGKNLLSTSGDVHRRQRKTLNPVFSINHMRRMLPIFNNVTDRLRSALITTVAKDPEGEVDLSRWMSRTALELIGQAGLGYSFDSLVKDTPNEYATAIKELPSTLFELEALRDVFPYIYNIFPKPFLRWVVKVFPSRRLRRAGEIVDTLESSSVKILAEKRAAFAAGDEAIAEQIGEGRDLMSVLRMFLTC